MADVYSTPRKAEEKHILRKLVGAGLRVSGTLNSKVPDTLVRSIKLQ
jgi:hypothetical protein